MSQNFSGGLLVTYLETTRVVSQERPIPRFEILCFELPCCSQFILDRFPNYDFSQKNCIALRTVWCRIRLREALNKIKYFRLLLEERPSRDRPETDLREAWTKNMKIMSSQTQTLFTEKTDKGTFANVTNVTSRRTLNLTEYKMYFQFLINPSYFCPSQECFLFLGRKNFRY